MIRYKKYQNNNPKSPAYNKWFGRAVHELVEFDELVTHMANHHCVFSEATIRGVLIEAEICLRELLLEGKGKAPVRSLLPTTSKVSALTSTWVNDSVLLTSSKMQSSARQTSTRDST